MKLAFFRTWDGRLVAFQPVILTRLFGEYGSLRFTGDVGAEDVDQVIVLAESRLAVGTNTVLKKPAARLC
ncbi:hypothetical protein N7461_004067 [Penicillium sp. DV-2018c]|nr:hypothetical protein N7461_004067 [Penicillium sp. DV-2018c]